jgi:hypothetical protein
MRLPKLSRNATGNLLLCAAAPGALLVVFVVGGYGLAPLHRAGYVPDPFYTVLGHLVYLVPWALLTRAGLNRVQ